MEALLVRDIMRIGVLTCRPEEPVQALAARLLDQNCTSIVVLDEDGDARGWINEQCLVEAYLRQGQTAEDEPLTAADVMREEVPDCPAEIPVTAAVQLMADLGADHLFCLHHAGGRAWPASVISLRDIVRALAGPEYIHGQGAGAPRPTPMDLFRQRYGQSGSR